MTLPGPFPYKFNLALLPPEGAVVLRREQGCVEFRKTGYEELDEGTLEPWLGKWQPEDFNLSKMKAKFDN